MKVDPMVAEYGLAGGVAIISSAGLPRPSSDFLLGVASLGSLKVYHRKGQGPGPPARRGSALGPALLTKISPSLASEAFPTPAPLELLPAGWGQCEHLY